MDNFRQRLFTLEEVMRLGVNVADVPIGTTIKGLWMPINVLNGGLNILFLLSIDMSGATANLVSNARLVYDNKNGSLYYPTAYISGSDATLYVAYCAISTNNTIALTTNKYTLFGIYSPIALGNGGNGDGYGTPILVSLLKLYHLNAMFYGDDNTYYVYLNFEPLCITGTYTSTPIPTTITLKTKPSASKQIYCVTA